MAWNPEVTVAAIVERDSRFSWSRSGSRPPGASISPPGISKTGETLAGRGDPRNARGDRVALPPRRAGRHLPVAQARRTDAASCVSPSAARSTIITRKQPLDNGIVRALWMTHEQLLAQPARLRSPMVLRCLRGLPARQAPGARIRSPLGLESALQMDAVVNL